MKTKIQIAHVHLETPLVLSDNFVQVLIVENPTEFFNMVTDLCGQFEGSQGTFVFSSGLDIINATKCGTLITDLFNFELNDKNITSLLHKRLEAVVFSEKLVEFNALTSKMMEFLGNISFEFPFLLQYKEPQPTDYFKASGLKLENDYESLEEKIICYINAMIELKKCEFFIFINLKSVLNDDKLLQIYKHCRLEQVGLLLIESKKSRPLLSSEKAVIITEDLCEILENYEEMV